MQLSSVTISPLAAHTCTAVFLHGRGDNAQSLSQSLSYSKDSRGQTLADAFPSSAGISQWFDIWNVSDFAEREELQAAGLKESVSGIGDIITKEAEVLGGRYDRVILAGISQGAATSVHTILNLNLPDDQQRLGAVLGFSCRMPFPGRSLADTRAVLGLDSIPGDNRLLRNTPVLLEHCVDDPLVLFASGRALRDTLRRFGCVVKWKEYPDGGHWFNSPQGMDDAIDFLNKSCFDMGQTATIDAMDISS